MSNEELTDRDLIQSIEDNDALSQSDKLQFFVSLCDGEALKEHLSRNAMMVSVGMTEATIMDTFVYGVLRIGRPELFVGEKDGQ